MPAKRRTSARQAGTSGQSTLSFGSRSKITKPLVDIPSKKKNPESAFNAISQEEIAAPTTAEAASIEQTQVETAKPPSPEEEEAGKVTETQLKKYWKALEDERKAPRVHQQGLNLNEKILRHFDLSSQYGPCIGIARMKRWKRANNLKLHPPIEVLAVLLKEESKENNKSERAYIDELMSSRFSME